jgi:Ca2+-binding RTX toxin-like protein
MRASLGIFAVLLVVLCLPAGGWADTSSSPAPPSCADGPTTVGGTTYGTPCADLIVAAPGVETVAGGPGDDTILAAPLATSAPCPSGCHLGVGSQTFEGGPGDDVVYGERGNDTLRGGEGNDQLFGGIGDDVLRGGPGNDRLAGGFGADSIDGEGGDDYVHGDGTIDRIADSGGGTDTLSFASGVTPGFGGSVSGFPGFPTAAEGRGVRLDLGAAELNADNGVAPFGGGVDEVKGAGFETVIGTPFSDYIVGTGAPETIYGGGGADVIVGGGGGDTLDGGADGDSLDGAGSVVQRDPTKVSVGFMAPGTGAYSQLYLAGSNGKDAGTATYGGGAVTFALTAGAFDQSASAAAGCAVSTTQATCALATPLDSLVLAGLNGDDSLSANGFPSSVTVVELGGEGGDSLSGGAESEDVLVDGPDSGAGGADALAALGGDDALLHNAGADQLSGGDGNDLFLSNSICDGNHLSGDAGRDNASWARFGEGVGVNLASGEAGRPGSGITPACGGSLDSLEGIEDLEGSGSADAFYGDAGPNQLLGHLGPDTYSAAAGADTILANSGDSDPAIDCGDDVDRALVDRHPQYDDAAPVNCEAVSEADPNSFQILPDFPIPTPPPPEPSADTPPVSPAPEPPLPPVADTTPPRTRLLAHPRAVLITSKRERRVVFRFASSEPGARFRCRLDRQPYRACTSPRAFSMSLGRHTVGIAAVDRAGNTDPTPARFALLVRRR